MSDTSQILLTILTGVLIFVLGQITIKFIVEPYQNYRKLVGEIAEDMLYFLNVGQLDILRDLQLQSAQEGNLVCEQTEVQSALRKERDDWLRDQRNLDNQAKVRLRQRASELMAVTTIIPLYGLWACFRLVPKRKNVVKASANLIGYSNSTLREDRDRINRVKEIANALNIKMLKDYFGDRAKN